MAGREGCRQGSHSGAGRKVQAEPEEERSLRNGHGRMAGEAFIREMLGEGEGKAA